MCSSLLGLGGTHVQQCSECRISRICVPYSRSFKRNSIAASYQHHAGLQPANLVTAPTVSCSRSELLLLLLFVFFFHPTSSFHPVFQAVFQVSELSGCCCWRNIPPQLSCEEQPPAAVELYYFYSAVRSSLPLPPSQLHLFYSAVRSSFFKSYLIANPKMIRTFSIVNQF